MPGLGHVSIKLDLWTLKFEFHTIFCVSRNIILSIFFQLLINVENICSLQTIQKQVACKIWPVGSSWPTPTPE